MLSLVLLGLGAQGCSGPPADLSGGAANQADSAAGATAVTREASPRPSDAASGDAPAALATGLVISETDSAGVTIVSIDGPADALPEWSLTGAPIATISGDAPPFQRSGPHSWMVAAGFGSLAIA